MTQRGYTSDEPVGPADLPDLPGAPGEQVDESSVYPDKTPDLELILDWAGEAIAWCHHWADEHLPCHGTPVAVLRRMKELLLDHVPALCDRIAQLDRQLGSLQRTVDDQVLSAVRGARRIVELEEQRDQAVELARHLRRQIDELLHPTTGGDIEVSGQYTVTLAVLDGQDEEQPERPLIDKVWARDWNSAEDAAYDEEQP